MTARTYTPRYAWVVSAVAFCLGIGTMTGVMAWAYLSPFIAEDYGVAVTDIAIYSSIYNLCMMGAGFLTGMLGDRFGPRLICGIGECMAGVMLILAGLVQGSLVLMGIFYCAAGLFASTCGSAMMPKIISAWFEPKFRGRGMLTNTLGGSIWGAVVGIIGPWAIVGWGWRGGFILLGCTVLAAGLIWYIFARDTPVSVGTIPFGADPETYQVVGERELTDEEKAAIKREHRRAVARVLKNKFTWFFSLFYVIWMMGGLTVSTYRVAALMGSGYDVSVSGYIISLSVVFTALGQFVWAPLCDKFSRKKVLAFVIAMSGVLFALCWFCLDTGQPAWLVIVVFCIQGLFSGSVPIYQSIMGELYEPDIRGTGPGVLVTFSLIGSFGGPLVGAWVINLLGEGAINFIYLQGAVVYIVAALIVLALLPNTGGKYGDPVADEYYRKQGLKLADADVETA